MSDYISRKKLRKKKKYIFQTESGAFPKSEWFYKFDDVESIPSADVRENIHGTWEEWKVGKYEGVPICSVCKHGFPLGFKQYNFCPNCGADMRGEADGKT